MTKKFVTAFTIDDDEVILATDRISQVDECVYGENEHGIRILYDGLHGPISYICPGVLAHALYVLNAEYLNAPPAPKPEKVVTETDSLYRPTNQGKNS